MRNSFNQPLVGHEYGLRHCKNAGGVIATLGTGLSLRHAVRMVEAAWMLGLVAEQLGGEKR